MHGGAFVTPAPLFDFRVVAKGFDIFAELHKRTEGGDARDFSLHELTDFVALEPLTPNVIDLLDTQRDAAILRIDPQDLGGNGFAFFEHFVGILYAPGPAHGPNVHQAVKAVLDFDERAELRDVANLAGHHGADGIFVRELQPGIRLRLLDTERNAAAAGLDFQDHDMDPVPNFHQ